MERYMYNEESFERTLKQKVDEYRMYPSNQTWNNIENKLQKPKSYFTFKAIGLTIVLLSTVSIYFSDYQHTNLNNNSITLLKSFNKSTADRITEKNIASFQPKQKTERMRFSIIQNQTQQIPSTINETSVSEMHVLLKEQEEFISKDVIAFSETVKPETVELNTIEKIDANNLRTSTNSVPVVESEPHQKLSTLNPVFNKEVTEQQNFAKTDAELNYEVSIPIVTNKKELKYLSYYITPSYSYRVLYADNKLRFGNFPQLDPENEVTHTPSIGIETGASILFPVTKRIKFRTGLQFNYTRYNVSAYNSIPQLTTVRLNYSTTQRLTVLGNANGFISKDVQNETYQISIPVGLEVNIAGNKKVSWEIGANVQPSFLVKASGYLLTTDYKNYIKAPDLLNHLNLNSGLETFIRWDAGKFKFQAGPQLRYQLFSNSKDDFPVKEHLVEYGFRFGIIKPIR